MSREDWSDGALRGVVRLTVHLAEAADAAGDDEALRVHRRAARLYGSELARREEADPDGYRLHGLRGFCPAGSARTDSEAS